MKAKIDMYCFISMLLCLLTLFIVFLWVSFTGNGEAYNWNPFWRWLTIISLGNGVVAWVLTAVLFPPKIRK